MRIFIRADGGKVIGFGHIMRMLVLAKELKKHNEVIFICIDSKDNKFKAGIEKVKQENFQVIFLTENNLLNDIINVQLKYKADMIITDSYKVDEFYFRSLKKYFKLTGYMDDVNKCKMDVDFIINQNINALDLDYSKNVDSNVKLFLGTKYCLIREEFRKKYKKKIINRSINNILLTVGGMDKDNITFKILNCIRQFNKNINVVIGPSFEAEKVKKILDLSKEYTNIKLIHNANMSDLMLESDVAISGCGSTLYELCSMSVPTIGIIIAENQENISRKMKDMELIMDYFYLNEFDFDEFNISSRLENLMSNLELKKNIIKNQKININIFGVQELSKEINSFKL